MALIAIKVISVTINIADSEDFVVKESISPYEVEQERLSAPSNVLSCQI